MTDRNDITSKRQEIVAKLTQARLEKGLSQAQLAELVGTQRSNICRIENGGQNLTLDLLIKISNALDKDVNVLLEEKRSQTTNTYHMMMSSSPFLWKKRAWKAWLPKCSPMMKAKCTYCPSIWS